MITFFDTNIFVYAIDAGEPVKKSRAIARITEAREAGTVVLSTQVLQEFYSITTRKLRPALTAHVANQFVNELCAFQVMGADVASIRAACALVTKHKMQWWDALILEAAMRAKANVLVSEDGQAGRRFGSMVVENPFLKH
ncbi:MAG: PIN domain-containing protein [Gammaproteobacteria bacterium]|nr:PIN domain-containing protein [Gammaproteobacteria bacterium]